jgi:hypothetical protein
MRACFAGDDYTRARYYDFDSDYLIEMEPHVRHYDLYSATSPDPSLVAAVIPQRILAAPRLTRRGDPCAHRCRTLNMPGCSIPIGYA